MGSPPAYPVLVDEIDGSDAASKRVKALKASAKRAKDQAKQLKARADVADEQVKAKQARTALAQARSAARASALS
jgi:hypothetical protein